MKKVLVIGSGPIIIGQAAEFDYAGTQACQALREEGIEVVLVNNNPATIMTDEQIADKVYLEPLNVPTLEAIIERERPDGLLPTLGGQTGLNLAVALAEAGILDRYNIRLLGTPITAIKQAEDRELFRNLMHDLGQPIPASAIAHTLAEVEAFVSEHGLPAIIRPAYTLGGTGGGIATTWEELREIATMGLQSSPITQVLIEQSIAGWKEIEYEVLRDRSDTCITICNMENIDPVGIHTGDSIVIAPSQTLTDREYQLLRSAAINIIRALKIEGGCNVQFALHPDRLEYAVIEVNPRVSRSSALASKATGYPIARVAAKIAIGQTLDQIKNPVTGVTYASFEPALDYVVVKLPRWPFDKFPQAHRILGTQMKATGEVMAIERNIEAALQKALRSLDVGLKGPKLAKFEELETSAIAQRLQSHADDERLLLIFEALRRGVDVPTLHEWTQIDSFFLTKFERMIEMEREIVSLKSPPSPQELHDHTDFDFWQTGVLPDSSPLSKRGARGDLLKKAKERGFSDAYIAELLETSEANVRQMRKDLGITTRYRQVDTCAAEFPAQTPYYYGTYAGQNEAKTSTGKKVLVLGSGPIRISQGIEFDYCSVHAAMSLKALGYESVMLNNNPETVSTDFDIADRLYFDPLALEDVLNVIDQEQVSGVMVQFGGQTAINLAGALHEVGVPILGTSVASIDLAEDRDKFRTLLDDLEIPQTKGGTAKTLDEALSVATNLGYPLMIRPSYVIGGRAMQVAYDESDLRRCIVEAFEAMPGYPVLLDQYLIGKEVEVDAIADGDNILIPGIFEHIEKAGVHSGDSMAVYPPQTLSASEIETLIEYTQRLARALNVVGLFNIQFVISDGQIIVLEVNPRASRTVPILSKVTGVPMIDLAVQVQLGRSLADLGYGFDLYPDRPLVAVKAPVFSFEKLAGVDSFLGPEMRSTGELLAIASTYAEALGKAFIQKSLQRHLETGSGVIVSLSDRAKAEALPLVKGLQDKGLKIWATAGTAGFLESAGLRDIDEVSGDADALKQLLRKQPIIAVVNIPTIGNDASRSGFLLRQQAMLNGVTCLTSLDTLRALLHAWPHLGIPNPKGVHDWQINACKQELVVSLGANFT